MKKNTVIWLGLCILSTAYFPGESKPVETTGKTAAKAAGINLVNRWENVIPSGQTIATRLPVPPGFQRVPAAANSIGHYLRHLPVKSHRSPVLLYNGSLKNFQGAQAAVIDMEIGTRDLQQCADAVMRLRAEYLFQQQKYGQIHFNFTSGHKADYQQFAQGYRPVIDGNKVTWQKKVASNNSYQTFRKYLDLVFTYAGTASLEKELQPVKSIVNIAAGDVLIQGGHPGHAVMVVDVAVNPKTGDKVYLLAQSYMPAQDMHVLQNPSDKSISPWYSASETGRIDTPEWTFYPNNLKRFPEW